MSHALDNFPVSSFLNRAECEFSKWCFKVLAGRDCIALVLASLVLLITFIFHFIHRLLDMPRLNSSLRELSLAVVVLNVFYNPRRSNGYQFTWSGVILLIAACGSRLPDIIKHCRERRHPSQHLIHTEETEDTSDVDESQGGSEGFDHSTSLSDVKMSQWLVMNRYQMMSMRFTSILALFWCQLALGMFYMYSFLAGHKGWDNSSALRWFTAMLLCNLASEDGTGRTFHLPFWLKLISNKTMKNEGLRRQICIRMFMSFIVNLCIRRIILSTAPIILSVVDDPLAFIKDSLAVFFITRLDDLDHPINFKSDFEKSKRIREEVASGSWFRRTFGLLFERGETDDEVFASVQEVRELKKKIAELERPSKMQRGQAMIFET